VTIAAAPSGGTTATAVATVVNGVLTNITVTNAGAGYVSQPALSLTNAPGAAPSTAATATLVLEAPAAGGTVLTLQMVNGQATFTGLNVDKLGSYTFQATVGDGVLTAGNAPITVTARQFAVTSQPTSVPAGSAFPLTITAQDSAGNIDSSYNGTVALSEASGPTGASIGGTLIVPVVNGVANWPALTITKAGTYTLKTTILSGPSLAAFTTPALTITPQTASQLVVATQPPASVLADDTDPDPFGLTVKAEDQYGNVDTNYTGPVTLAMGNNPTGATLLAGVGQIGVSNGGSGYSQANPPAVVLSGDATTGASAVAVINSAGQVTGVTVTGVSGTPITNIGLGYQTPPTVTFGAPTGTNNPIQATGTAVLNSNGQVMGVIITNPGSGYVLPPTIGFSAPSNTATPGTPVVSGGVITSVPVTNGGSGYQFPPTVTFSGGAPTATQTGVGILTNGVVTGISLSGITSITVTNPGSGYNSAPTVQILGGPAGNPSNGSTATAVVSNGAVIAINVINPGTGWTSLNPPQISLIPTNGGSGAAANTVNLTTPGVGYTAVPTVAITAPNVTATAGTVTLSSGQVSTVPIGNVGAGYLNPPLVTFTAAPSGGTTATGVALLTNGNGNNAVVTGVSTSGVISIPVDNGGSGYTSPPTVQIAAPTGSSPMQAYATAVLRAGVVVGIVVTSTGQGYTARPAVTISAPPPGGTQATVTTANVVIATPGSGYTSAPTATIQGPQINGALGFATLSGGAVTAIAVGVSAGYNFTPTVTIPNSPTGDNATATAIVSNGLVVAIQITHGGSGYSGTVTPTIQAVTPGTAAASTAIASPGSGFAAPPVITFNTTGTTGSGAAASATLGSTEPAVSTFGGVFDNGVATFSGLSIDKAGTGYTLVATAPGLASTTTSPFTVTPAFGDSFAEISPQDPATATATVTGGKVTAINLTSGAGGYSLTSPPTITISGGGGNGATAAPVISNGAIIGITTSGVLSIALPTATLSGYSQMNPPLVTISGNGAGATATATVNSSGVVTGFVITNPGSGYSSATATVATPDGTGTTATGTVSVASPGSGYTSPPAVAINGVRSVPASAPFTLIVSILDDSGNVATSFTGSVTVSLVRGQGTPGATLGGTLTIPAIKGIATFSNLTIDKAGTGYQLNAVFTLGGTFAIQIFSPPFTVTADAATQLAVTSPPPSNVTAGAPFGFTVAAEDPSGNIDTTFNNPVTVAFGASPAGATIPTGVASIAVENGGSGYTSAPAVTFTGGGGSGAAASAVVHNGVVIAVNVTSPGSGYTSPPTVLFNGVTTSAAAAAILGTTVTAVGGVATFANLTLPTAGSYTLVAAGGGLPAVTAGAVTVSPAAIDHFQVSTQPPSTVATNNPFNVQIAGVDKFGNVVTGFSTPVTVALTSAGGATLAAGVGAITSTAGSNYNPLSPPAVRIAAPPAGGTQATAVAVVNGDGLHAGQITAVVITNPGSGYTSAPSVTIDSTGTTGSGASAQATLGVKATPVNGIATFTNLSVNVASTSPGYTLTTQPVPGVTAATTSAFLVSSTAATKLSFSSSTPPPTSATAGGVLGGTAGVVVVADNSSFSGPVTLSLGNDPTGAALNGTTTAYATNGTATFTGLTLNVAGSYTLVATSNGLTATAPAALTVNAGTATQLVTTAQAPPFSQATATVALSGTSISTAAVTPASGLTSGGSGYTTAPVVTITAANGIGAGARRSQSQG
jgi:hypothetical protein